MALSEYGAEDGEPLLGGNISAAVVRVGDTVRRPTGNWTPAVHALLRHLNEAGYPGAPVLHGRDARDREVLEYVPGTLVAPEHFDVLTSEMLTRVGMLVRRFHEAVGNFKPNRDAEWRPDGRDPSGDEEIVCHNDMAPWNLVINERRLVFIDWDMAAPGRRIWDFANTVQTFSSLFPSVEDAPAAVRRIHALCQGYGFPDSELGSLLTTMGVRTRHYADVIESRSATGDAAYGALLRAGHARTWRDASDFIAANAEHWYTLLIQMTG